MNIAVCFSGHLRNFSDLLDNFKEKILIFKKDHEVDLFFSLWDTYEPEFSWQNQNKTISKKIELQNILELNPAKIEVENFQKNKRQLLLNNFTDLQCNNDKIIKDGILYSTSMFYKLYKCNLLKKEFEKSNKITYDLVIRYRSNLFIDGDINLNISKNILYTKRSPDSTCLDDIFAYADTNIMDIYSNVYPNLSLILNKYKNFGPENILYNWIVTENKIQTHHTEFDIKIIR
jgi:hypothetical protein